MKCGEFMPLIDNYLLDNYRLDGPSFELEVGNYDLYYDSRAFPTTTSTTPVKVITFTVMFAGTYRILFSLYGSNGTTSIGRIYVNGVARGILRTAPTGINTTYVEDIQLNAGDKVEFYHWTNGQGAGSGAVYDPKLRCETMMQYSIP